MTTISDDDYYKFFSVIGRAITIWSDIEHQLAIIYRYLVNDHTDASYDSFFAIRQLQTKLEVVEAASRAGFNPLDHEDPSVQVERIHQWHGLYKRMYDEKEYRNRLAHWRVVRYTSPETDGREELRLMRKHNTTPKPNKDSMEAHVKSLTDSISYEEVYDYIDKVSVILSDLTEFTKPLEAEIGDRRLQHVRTQIELHRKQK